MKTPRGERQPRVSFSANVEYDKLEPSQSPKMARSFSIRSLNTTRSISMSMMSSSFALDDQERGHVVVTCPNEPTLRRRVTLACGIITCLVCCSAVAAAVVHAGVFRHHNSADVTNKKPVKPASDKPASDKPATAPSRKGSFLVIGDWGYDDKVHGKLTGAGCQRAIADAMMDIAEQLGDVRFIVNVGDSFYPSGVRDKHDEQWETKWRNVYAKELRSVPWYSVYGNHDYQHDPCACSETPSDCAQVNGNISNLDFFYMPSPSWFRRHPELGVEVIALDLNAYQTANGMEDCHHSQCAEKCGHVTQDRSKQAMDLFFTRSEHSDMKSLLVFSHYPTDYFWNAPAFLGGLRNETRNITYFGGHRHNVDQTSTISIAPNDNWLVGGGGGWSCDQSQQGFLVGEIDANSRVTTRPILVDPAACCLR